MRIHLIADELKTYSKCVRRLFLLLRADMTLPLNVFLIALAAAAADEKFHNVFRRLPATAKATATTTTICSLVARTIQRLDAAAFYRDHFDELVSLR